MDTEKRAPIRVFVSDLYFTIRIDKIAELLGYETETADKWIETPAALLVFDLDQPGIDWETIIKEVRRPDSAAGRVPILAFGSHVNPEKLRAARRAGADMAVAKSRFMKETQILFQSLLGQPGSA